MELLARVLLGLLGLAATARSLPAQVSVLEAGFRTPPDSARPHTWWHWMDGQITKEGITADLEAMRRVGIGGAQIFQVACGTGPGPVRFLSPEWSEMIAHAVREADRLGLELGIHDCAGWSSSGGPWVRPAQAMQELVWTETRVRGRFSGILPQPATRWAHYRDVAVLALPLAVALGKAQVVRRRRIVDLTSRLGAGGRLDWTAPAGDWTVLRIGHTPTGATNRPSPPEGRGPECDKMSRAAVDAFFGGMMQAVLDAAGPLAGKSLRTALIDSYEVGGQNWTPRFREEFRARRGYDPVPFLPVLTGRIVDSAAVTERFEWDFRRSIADLFADRYFGRFAELCRQHGLGFAVEGYGNGPFDDLTSAGRADIPMTEFWVGPAPASHGYDRGAKEAASAAHTYGRRYVGAEAFTATTANASWHNHPWTLKTLGDSIYCSGVNRFYFHRFAHQPWVDRFPGMTMGPWGTHFDRTNTWWEPGRAWMRYLARCQLLLQAGRFVADICWFYGEAAPNRLAARDRLRPALPDGYDFDGCNAEVLRTRMSVEDGRLALPGGMRYRLLVLPDGDRMTPGLLRRIRDLVRAGATVVGRRPTRSPSLQGYPGCDDDVRRIAGDLWGPCDGKTVLEHRFGRGRVVQGRPLDRILAEAGIEPDFAYDRDGGARLLYIHRRVGQADFYFVSNQRHRPETVACTFRVTGREPELWRPDTGEIRRVAVFENRHGRTTLPLFLEPAASVFVVFRSPLRPGADPILRLRHDGEPAASARPPGTITVDARGNRELIAREAGVFEVARASGRVERLAVRPLPPPLGIGGPWTLRFPPGRGAPERVELPRLASWTAHPVPGVRYFSGTATYTKTFDVPAARLAAAMVLELHLGDVQVMAEVRLNGRDLGILWKPPFTADITAAARPGPNRLEVRVTNLWPNRLIGDAGIPMTDPLPARADVTAILRNAVAGDRLHIRASNALFGDPAPGIVKALRVDYRLGGQKLTATVPENGELVLGSEGKHLVITEAYYGEPSPPAGRPRPSPQRKRYTWTTRRMAARFTKDSPLLPSGLLGPVLLRSCRRLPLHR